MFATGPNYSKLKTNLRLAINRLKLLEKKKTELAQKARKEIADYIQAGKYERAKIRVEHIIREDYLVEAMEVVEMYCDLLIARFGLIQQMKTLDEGLAEPISSLIWVAPRLQSDVAELKLISDQLSAKYGKQYSQACRENAVQTVSEKLMHKLSVQAPPKILVEKYLVEIAKNYNVEYEPDPQVMREDDTLADDALLINLGDGSNNLNKGGNDGGSTVPPQAGFVGFPQPPVPSASEYKPFNYPPMGGFPSAPSNVQDIDPPYIPPPATYNIPPANENLNPYDSPPDKSNLKPPEFRFTDSSSFEMGDPPPYSSFLQNPNFPPSKPAGSQYPHLPSEEKPKPAPRTKLDDEANLVLPELPSVPNNTLPGLSPGGGADNDDIDFDDLTKRFENLKKRK